MKKRREPKSPTEEKEPAPKKIRTVNNSEVSEIVVPPMVKAQISSFNINWLWSGGVFTLPRKVKEQLKIDCQGDMRAYLKAKIMVTFFFI